MSIYVNIQKKLGNFRLTAKLQAEDEVLALLGASGSGKSMTLKCIAGIMRPDRGVIRVDDLTYFDSEKRINLTPQERMCGLMFQNYALFPQMTVEENILTGTHRMAGKEKREALASRFISDFGLESVRASYPSQISGGQQQRTALARILVSKPRILLLDEPFSALDSHLRLRLEEELRERLRRFGKTVLLVSHDRDEVYRLSSRVAVMREGSVVSLDEKKTLFSRPENRETAILTGYRNISAAKRVDDGHILASDWGIVLAKNQAADHPYLGLRTQDFKLGDEKPAYPFEILDEIEDSLNVTLVLKLGTKEKSQPIFWTIEKNRWKKLRSCPRLLSIPEKALLPLDE